MPELTIHSDTSANDRALKLIYTTLNQEISPESVILSGSRATGGADATSDYDIVVWLSTWKAILYYIKLKRLESKLADLLKTSVTVNPLTPFVSKQDNNLFLLKLRLEGVVLSGSNVLTKIRTTDPKKVSSRRIFSYLFTALRVLLENVKPGFNSNASFKVNSKTGKALIKAYSMCGELWLLSHGMYESQLNRIITLISKTAPGRTIRDPNQEVIHHELREMLKSIKSDLPIDGTTWFSCRDRLISLLSQRTKNISVLSDETDVLDLSETYLNHPIGSRLKNLEYFMQSAIKGKFKSLNWVLRKRRVDQQIHVAVLMLVSAIKPDGSISRKHLEAAKLALSKIMPLRTYDSNREDEWLALRDTILVNWSSTETIMGVF